jgi:hypothetical protein
LGGKTSLPLWNEAELQANLIVNIKKFLMLLLLSDPIFFIHEKWLKEKMRVDDNYRKQVISGIVKVMDSKC